MSPRSLSAYSSGALRQSEDAAARPARLLQHRAHAFPVALPEQGATGGVPQGGAAELGAHLQRGAALNHPALDCQPVRDGARRLPGGVALAPDLA